MIEVLAALALFLQTPTGNMLTPRTVDKGGQSEVAAPRQVTIRDADAWAALWRAHAPDRPQPAVDFAREMVVGIFLGTRPTAGFAVEIAGYRLEDNRLVVTYRESRPAAGTLTAQVLTAPFHLAAIPRNQHFNVGRRFMGSRIQFQAVNLHPQVQISVALEIAEIGHNLFITQYELSHHLSRRKAANGVGQNQ